MEEGVAGLWHPSAFPPLLLFRQVFGWQIPEAQEEVLGCANPSNFSWRARALLRQWLRHTHTHTPSCAALSGDKHVRPIRRPSASALRQMQSGTRDNTT